MSDERTTLHIKLAARLPARVDANAREEGLSRAEWVRGALAAAALKSEQQTDRRRRLEARPEAMTSQ